MRTITLIGILFFSVASLLAQSAEEETMRLKQQSSEMYLEESPQEDMLHKDAEQEKKKPGNWNFSVGTSYSFMKGYGSGMSFYTAPTYTLALNERWSLHGGVIASYYQGLNFNQPQEDLWPASFTSLSVFAAASYRMSDRLILHGAGVKQLLTAPVTPFTPYPMGDLSLGATYKIGDNMTIGASVHMRNSSGYYNSPFGSTMFPSPFGW